MQTSSIAIVRRTRSARIVLRMLKGALAAATLASGAAFAVPITYTETFTDSGTLGSLRFSNALVTLSLTGDTANVTNLEAGVFDNVGAMTIRVGGSFATFTDQMEAVADQLDSRVGVSDVTRDEAVVFVDAGSPVASYDLRTAIGPVGGVGLPEGSDFPTTDGILDFDTRGAPPPATFTAAVASASASVPEPSELWLLAAGVLGFGLMARKNATWRAGPRVAQRDGFGDGNSGSFGQISRGEGETISRRSRCRAVLAIGRAPN